MNFTKEFLLPTLAWMLVVVALAAVLTGVYLWDFSSNCAESGGSYSIDGGTAWCRY